MLKLYASVKKQMKCIKDHTGMVVVILCLSMILVSVTFQGSPYMNAQGSGNQTGNQSGNQTGNQTSELSEFEEGEEIGAEETL